MSTDYEPALEAPETPDAPTDIAAAVVGDDAVEARQPRGMRGMSDKTRALFAKVAEVHKGGELEVDELVPATGVEPSEAAAPAPTAQGSPTAAKPGESAPAAAAAPTTDIAANAVDKQRQVALEAHEQTLKDREAKLAEREKTLPTADAYAESPAKTIIGLIKHWIGDDADLKEHLGDLVSELSAEGLGMALPEQLKTQIDSRKALRSVKTYKAETARKEAALAKERESLEQKQRETNAVGALAYVFGQQDTQTKFPFLASEDAPHAIVWDVIKRQNEKTGETLHWEKAAELAEKYLSDQARAFYAKRERLLKPAALQQPAPKQTTQGVSPQNRQAPQVPTQPTAPVPSPTEVVDEGTRRRQSLSKLMPRFKESTP